MKRFLCLLAAFTLVVSLALPVSADESASSWTELLQYATVNDSGSNVISYTTGASISIPTPKYMRCTKIDMLITYTSGTKPDSVNVRYTSNTYPLTVQEINATTARVYGDIPDTLYANVLIEFSRSATTTSYLEVLSCRVSSVVTQDFTADAYVLWSGSYYSTATQIPLDAATSENVATDYQVAVVCYDWHKFDQVTIWGSVTDASLQSIRVSVGSNALPFTVNYIDVESSGTWAEWVVDAGGDTGASLGSSMYGKYLFAVTVDLSSLDRVDNATNYLWCYINGNFIDTYGAVFNCQSVGGSIYVPDTSDASWWTRFTDFMTDLFNRDDSDSEEFESTMESQGAALEDAVDQMDQVTRPAVEDLDAGLDSYVSSDDMVAFGTVLEGFVGNNLILTMLMITLTVALVAYVLYGKR